MIKDAIKNATENNLIIYDQYGDEGVFSYRLYSLIKEFVFNSQINIYVPRSVLVPQDLRPYEDNIILSASLSRLERSRYFLDTLDGCLPVGKQNILLIHVITPTQELVNHNIMNNGPYFLAGV